MDIVNAVPYIRKFKKHPVTGEPLELKDLIRWADAALRPVSGGSGLSGVMGAAVGGGPASRGS